MAGYVQLPSGVVITEAEFAEMNPPAPEMREIATTRDGRDITRGFVDGLPLLPPQDSVLQTRGAGDYRVYDEVLRDDQVASALAQRRLAVVSREWDVQPGGKTAKDKAAAESLKEFLDGVNAGSVSVEGATVPLQGFDSATAKMLCGVFYGFSVAECLWGREGRFVTLEGIKVRKQRRFGFAPDGSMRLLTMRDINGEPLPPRKFWTFAVGADNDDDPYGLGLAHWLYWPVFFKRNGLKFWLIFLDKFGQPTGVGKYPTNATPEERRRLLQAVRAIQTDSGIILPEGMAIELIEAARSGTVDYTALYDRMNAAISKVVLGHTGSSDATPGRLGGEDNAADVRQDLVKADADLVCESFNRTVARWLTDWNFPGAAYPRVYRKIEDAEDLGRVAERELKVTQMGYRPTLQHVHDTYGGEWEVAPSPMAPFPGAEFAEGAPTVDVTTAQRANLQAEADAAVEEWIEQVRELVMEAKSLEDLRDRLAELYPKMDPARFAAVMGDALAAAHLAGRYDIMAGV